MFPCWKGKQFPVGVGNISLLEGVIFPCWRWKLFLVGEENVSLLEGEPEPFPWWMGKCFPVVGVKFLSDGG